METNVFDGMSNFDDFADTYLDFSQAEYGQSPIQTRSPAGKMEQLAAPSASIDPSQMMRMQQPPQTDRPRQYNAPSHEYDRFKQQTGFPAGAIANIDVLNQMAPNMGMGYNSGIDFNMDMSFNDNFDEFVDPTAIDGQPGPSTQHAQPPTRLFPGSHSQQAAQLQQQRQLAAAKASALAQQQMRQDSVTEKSASPTPTANGDLAKMAKDEADMDEDERLLASEEGKKLSSKERRQLRNKVSARAFRSRRKEYISQLEAEINQKNQDAADLRSRVAHLEAQNSQLSQLTRMLLGHPAFSTVLNDMSADPTILDPIKQEQRNAQTTSQPPNAEPVYVGMSTIPETSSLDFSTLNIGGQSAQNQQNRWAPQNFNFQQQQQVFAVRSLPEGPNVEELLSKQAGGKAIAPEIPEVPSLNGKGESSPPPAPDVSPKIVAPPPSVTDLATLNDPAFEVYANSPCPPASSAPETAVEQSIRMLNRSLDGKAPVAFKVVVTADAATLFDELEKMFSSLECVASRLDDATWDV